MGWFDIGSMGQAIWGAVTRTFTPPPPPPAPPAPVLPPDVASIQSGGLDRLRQASLIDWRVPPLEASTTDLIHNNAGSLISNNSGGLISNNSGGLINNNLASFSKPWWQIW